EGWWRGLGLKSSAPAHFVQAGHLALALALLIVFRVNTCFVYVFAAQKGQPGFNVTLWNHQGNVLSSGPEGNVRVGACLFKRLDASLNGLMIRVDSHDETGLGMGVPTAVGFDFGGEVVFDPGNAGTAIGWQRHLAKLARVPPAFEEETPDEAAKLQVLTKDYCMNRVTHFVHPLAMASDGFKPSTCALG
ncbi:MAG: hypothetical protein WCL11_27850, partial [Verrucomicrobiota bacterium]